MSGDKRAVYDFLRDAGMDAGDVDMGATVDHMMREMALGLEGSPSSLAMIPTYIDADAEILWGERAVVLDAGGTNLRGALVGFTDEGRAEIEGFTRRRMPGTGGEEVGREAFFDSLAALAEPLLREKDSEGGRGCMGFCFSYPTEILPNRDGRLIQWSKEVRAPEVEGRLIGSDLREALRRGGRAEPPDVVVLNDTTAALLAGKARGRARRWGGYAGFILGTGTNSCYVESNGRIGKLKGLDEGGRQVVNGETGGFACADRGEGDRRLGAGTARPDGYWLEKMISGGYFGSLVGCTAVLGCEGGLFGGGAADVLKGMGKRREIGSEDAAGFCADPYGGSGNALAAALGDVPDGDRRRLWFLIDALTERAAKLSAANLASSVLKGCGDGGETGAGRGIGPGPGPLAPFCISIDGSAYSGYDRFSHRVDYYLRPFLMERDVYYETVQVDDAPLIGAAAAALAHGQDG